MKLKTQAQRDSQINATEHARGAAAKRAEAKRQQQREQDDRDRAMADHVATGHAFGWKNWEYSEDYTTEIRVCRVCGATETRPVRL